MCEGDKEQRRRLAVNGEKDVAVETYWSLKWSNHVF